MERSLKKLYPAEQLKVEFALALMTAKQARRWRLHFVYKSLKLSALIEGVAYQSIQKSLHGGVKRAKRKLRQML